METKGAMNYRAYVNSDRTEDRVSTTYEQASDFAADLSEEFGWVDVMENVCGGRVLATYCNGRRQY